MKIVLVGALVLLFTGCLIGPGPLPTDGGLAVRDDITTETTWVPGPAACDVVVADVVRVRARLTIAAGTTVCFNANAGLLVEATGALSAVGTTDNRIVFTSTTATPGAWRGLAFLSNDIANALHFTDITYAGSPEEFCCGFFDGSGAVRGAVVVGDVSKAARVSIQNTTISSSAAMGITAQKGSRLIGFENNTFRLNGGFPVSLSLSAATDLDSRSVYSGGAMANMTNAVRLLDFNEKTESPVTLRKLDVPYAMNTGFAGKVFDIGALLTIEAGTRLEFEANSGLLILPTGSLRIEGTATARVTLTGRSPTTGFWKGVAVNSLTNQMAFTDLTFAGSDSEFCCGFFEPGGSSTKAGLVIGDISSSGAVAFSNSTITQSRFRGVSVLRGTFTPTGTNDITTGNGSPNLIP
jgi:hypothetical protein